MLGDIFKIMSWPMGFVIMALGRGGLFIVTQVTWNLVYLLFIWFGLDKMGILAAGIGYCVSYAVSLVVTWIMVMRLINFSAKTQNVLFFAALILAVGLILPVVYYVPHMAYVVGVLITIPFGIYSVYRINHMLNLGAWLRQKIGRPQ